MTTSLILLIRASVRKCTEEVDIVQDERGPLQVT